MLEVMGLSDVEVAEAVRLGTKEAHRVRPLKISLKSVHMKRKVLQNAKFLSRGESRYKSVFISPDRTPKQQALDKSLRMELKDRRSKGEKT